MRVDGFSKIIASTLPASGLPAVPPSGGLARAGVSRIAVQFVAGYGGDIAKMTKLVIKSRNLPCL